MIAAGTAQYGMQTFDQSLLQLYREELVTYETARDAATNPDDFDLKIKGIFSTGEMTWETSGAAATPRSTAAPTQPGMAVRRAGRGRAQPLRQEGGVALAARPPADAGRARRAQAGGLRSSRAASPGAAAS